MNFATLAVRLQMAIKRLRPFQKEKEARLAELTSQIKKTGERKTSTANAAAIADAVDDILRNQILIMETLKFLVEDKI